MVWCGVVRYREASFGGVWGGAISCGVVWCCVARRGVVWCDVACHAWCGAVWCGVMPCGVVLHQEKTADEAIIVGAFAKVIELGPQHYATGPTLPTLRY